MNEDEPKTNTDPEDQPKRRSRAGYFRAVVGSAMAVAGGEAVYAHPALAGQAEAVIQRLINPEDLPGRHITVSNEAVKALEDSTVTIDLRPQQDNDFNEIGTGKVVESDGQFYMVETSFHYLSQYLSGAYGNQKSRDNGTISVPGKRTIDITNLIGQDIQIGDKNIRNYHQRMTHPIGEVTQAEASAKDSDIVWLKVQAIPPTAPGYRSLEQIKPLDLINKQSEDLKNAPVPGQQVMAYSMPSTTKFIKPVAEKVTFLKRVKITNPDGSIRYLDYVGSKSKVCDPGASGSSYAATINAKTTYISGPLSDQYPASNTKRFLQFEKDTNVKLRGEFKKVCRYNVPLNNRAALYSSLSTADSATSTSP